MKDKPEPKIEQPRAPLPPIAESPIPVVVPKETIENTDPAQPFDHEFTGGVFVKRTDGEEYALCTHEPNGYGYTHSCKNTIHFWQGTENQFRLEFDKK